MRRLILVFASLTVLFSAVAAQAQNPPRVINPGPGPVAPPGRPPMPPYSKQAQIGAYGRAVYPKYYRAFHFREFENVGLPHGDIGTTGNGMTRTPW